MARVLFLGADQSWSTTLRLDFERVGHSVVYQEFRADRSVEQAIATIHERRANVVIIDGSGMVQEVLALCPRLRADEQLHDVPLILASTSPTEAERIKGLNSGADDYLAKAVSGAELVAKIGAITRRYQVDEDRLTLNELEISVPNHQVFVNEQAIALTKSEFQLLWQLASKPGRIFTRLQLLHSLGNERAHLSDRSIDAHVRSLRKKLGHHEWIETVYGVGYRFSETETSNHSAAL